METINEIIKDSINKHQVLKKLNWDTKTTGYRKLNRFIKKNNIDISHFETRKELYQRTKHIFLSKQKTYSLENILISGSTYQNTSGLKKRLYKEGLKMPICEKCGQDEWWHDEKIGLILDHINGIHDDNRIENLRIVCPNCEATLPTHCGRNSKKGRKKRIRVRKISEDEKFNKKKNQSIKSRKVERPPYELLKQQVKCIGHVATGERYGVSDNAIRKWIKFYEKYEEKTVILQ
jgi:hypothetical protein